MANISKRIGKNGAVSYNIRVSCGYDVNGKQIVRSRTWKVPAGMTARQEQKELQRQIVAFEEECENCEIGGEIRFKDFAEQWFTEYAPLRLKETSRLRYREIADEVYAAIGHLRLNQINSRHIQQFINDIMNKRTNKITEKPLATESIKYYNTFISSVLGYAMKQGIIKDNPCRRVLLPKPQKKEKQVYTLEQAQTFLDLLEEKAPLKYRAFFTLAIFGGFRNAEILGLEWKDIDFQNRIIEIRRTSNYSPDKGIYEDTPKTKKSMRTLHLPAPVFEILRLHRAQQNKDRFAAGERWEFTDRVFTQWNGLPMNNSTPRQWVEGFCKRNDIPYYGVHTFRHLNATLLIESGADIKTVSAALGHAQVSTTLNIYTHEVARAQARASEALGEMLDLKAKRA